MLLRMTGLSLFIIASLFLFTFLSLPTSSLAKPLREGECEVCLKDVGQFASELGEVKNAEAIESGIKKICKTYTDKADKRFCYYIGGSDDAATSLLRSISGYLLNHLPVTKICERLKQADGEICAVKYEKPPAPIDWEKVDLNKMRVKELKHIIDQWGEKCEGCTEKGDFLRLINLVKHKHIPIKQEL